MAVEAGSRRGSIRSRRDSVVQRIAHNVPQLEHHISLEPHHTGTLKRSKSQETLQPKPGRASDISFPFSAQEKAVLQQQYIDSFEYDVLNNDDPPHRNTIYDRFLQACEFRQHNYSELQSRSDVIIDNLTDLTVKYDTVTRETQEFQSQSDKLIDQFNNYTTLNESLKSDLHYYELLDSFIRKLNNPSPNIVRRDSFRRMLEQLDECITFIRSHPEHRESESFERRFKQCLTRALTLVRNYVVNNLKSIKDEITSKLNTTKSNSVTQDALIYTRFGSDAEFLKSISQELCDRAEESEEFEGLLNDCYNSYFAIRSKFLSARLYEHFHPSSTMGAKSLVSAAQGNISYVIGLLKSEYEVFYKVFSSDHGDALTQWFTQLAEPLYDALRNGILREPSLSSLAELATLLDKYYEYEDTEFDYQSEIQTFESQINLGKVFEPIWQDVQSRLVFRAQMYVQDKIMGYRPQLQDFDPNSNRKKVVIQQDELNDGAEDDMTVITSLATGVKKTGVKFIYPPVKRGIQLLSKIYQLVSSSVFDDLAHNIVHDCILSLRTGVEFYKKTAGVDVAKIYQLSNLLLLKDCVQDFDIEYVSSETFLDFSGIGDIISKIRNGESVLKNGSILNLVQESVPKVVKNMIDARQELQVELKNTVHEFTQHTAWQISSSIMKKDLDIKRDLLQFQEDFEVQLPKTKARIEDYIEDPYIITALIDGVQEIVIQSYEQFYQRALGMSDDAESLIEVETMVAFVGETITKMFESVEEEHKEEGDEEAVKDLEGLELQ